MYLALASENMHLVLIIFALCAYSFMYNILSHCAFNFMFSLNLTVRFMFFFMFSLFKFSLQTYMVRKTGAAKRSRFVSPVSVASVMGITLQ